MAAEISTRWHMVRCAAAKSGAGRFPPELTSPTNQRERQLYSPSVVENVGNCVEKLGLKHANVEAIYLIMRNHLTMPCVASETK